MNEWCVFRSVTQGVERVLIRIVSEDDKRAFSRALRWAKENGLSASEATVDKYPLRHPLLEAVGYDKAPILSADSP